MINRPEPEEVRRRLSYDPLTGVLTWRIEVSRNIKVGDATGTVDENGYVIVRMLYRNYRAHVLAFVIVEGRWPEHDVDHEDRVRSNNKWSNLRELTRAQNQQNHVGPTKASTTGVRGVCFCASKKWKKWVGTVSHEWKRHVKWFMTKEEAEEWVIATRKALHPFCPENATS